MFDLHSGLCYSVVGFFLLFLFLFAAIYNKWQNSWTICNLLIEKKEKKCIMKFGMVQWQPGDLWGSSVLGVELRQGRGAWLSIPWGWIPNNLLYQIGSSAKSQQPALLAHLPAPWIPAVQIFTPILLLGLLVSSRLRCGSPSSIRQLLLGSK